MGTQIAVLGKNTKQEKTHIHDGVEWRARTFCFTKLQFPQLDQLQFRELIAFVRLCANRSAALLSCIGKEYETREIYPTKAIINQLKNWWRKVDSQLLQVQIYVIWKINKGQAPAGPRIPKLFLYKITKINYIIISLHVRKFCISKVSFS